MNFVKKQVRIEGNFSFDCRKLFENSSWNLTMTIDFKIGLNYLSERTNYSIKMKKVKRLPIVLRKLEEYSIWLWKYSLSWQSVQCVNELFLHRFLLIQISAFEIFQLTNNWKFMRYYLVDRLERSLIYDRVKWFSLTRFNVNSIGSLNN